MSNPTRAQNLLQPGMLDPSFSPGSGPSAWLGAIELQADRKMIIAGAFTNFNGIQRRGIVRLNADGSVDPTFDPGRGTDDYVWTTKLQPDGKILIGGLFRKVDGTNRHWLARLDANGKLDPTLQSNFDAYNQWGYNNYSPVTALELQPDGKILVGGQFLVAEGKYQPRLARLYPDGKLDTSFSPPDFTQIPVDALALQPDGKLLVGGDGLYRLNPDGSPDSAFNENVKSHSRFPKIYKIVLLPDGRIVVCGGIGSSKWSATVARFHPDGTLDESFHPRAEHSFQAFPISTSYDVAVEKNGRIITGGYFHGIDGKVRNVLVRFNTDGSVDNTFLSHPAFEGALSRNITGSATHEAFDFIAIQEDGDILVGGNFEKYKGVERRGIARVVGGDLKPDSPIITAQPTNDVEIAGGSASFSVAALSALPVTYQWHLNDRAIPGATNRVLQLSNVEASQSGQYTVIVSNSVGSSESSAAVLEVRPSSFRPGDLDPEFDPLIEGYVHEVVEQPDTRLIIGGEFRSVNGILATNVARIDAAGNFDPSFSVGLGPQRPHGDGRVFALALQKDGKILIGGDFFSFNGLPAINLVRLNQDGSRDVTFNPGLTPLLMNTNGWRVVDAIAILPDGRIVIRGMGSETGSTSARLHPDGRIDTTYGSKWEPDPFVLHQTDGRMLTVEKEGLVRYNADYSKDETYAPIKISGDVVLQPDDKVLTSTAPGVSLTRFNTDGSKDLSFHNAKMSAPEQILLLANGKIMVSDRHLRSVDGVPRFGIARLFGDPADEPPKIQNPPVSQTTYAGQKVRLEAQVISLSRARFQWQHNGIDIEGATNRVLEVSGIQAAQSGDYTVVVRNDSGSVTSEPARIYVHLAPAGVPDPMFSIGAGFDGEVQTLVMQPENKLFAGGSFTRFNEQPRSRIAKLNLDGSLDESFNPPVVSGGTNPHIAAIAIEIDKQVLIGGSFTNVSGAPMPSLARLNADGTLDRSFLPTPATNLLVYAIALESDGQVLVGGDFQYTTSAFGHLDLVRLNPDGAWDSGFDADLHGVACRYIFCSDVSFVRALHVQRDGQIRVAGGFNRIGEFATKGLVRLDPDGTADTNFNAGLTLAGRDFDLGIPELTAMVVQPDGKLVVGGKLSFYASEFTPETFVRSVARFLPNGERDPNFKPDVQADGQVWTVALQPDGKILVGGSFTLVNGIPRKNVARLNQDGTVDQLFDPLSGPDGAVRAIAVLPDGGILIGGAFTHVNGIRSPGLARLSSRPDESLRLAVHVLSREGKTLVWPTISGKKYVLEASATIASPEWTPLTNVIGTGSIHQFIDGTIGNRQRYYRLGME